MPWKIEHRNGEWCVIKEDDGEIEGCHDSEEKAKSQLAALNANEPAMASMNPNQFDTLVYYGGSVKALGSGKVGGHLVLFSNEDEPDLENTFFDAETDYGPHKTSLVFYQHGLDKTLGKRVLDKAASLKMDDVGIWIEAQLALRDEYEQFLYEWAKKGKLGWSSGTASHLVDITPGQKATHISRWYLGLDASLTPIPAEPRTRVFPLKSLQLKTDTLEAVQTRGAAADGNAVDINLNIQVSQEEPKGKKKMNDSDQNGGGAVTTDTPPAEPTTPPENFATKSEVAALGTQIEGFSAQLTELMEALKRSGPLKDAGYIAPDDESGKPEVKSFADFLLAVYHGNHKRLVQVYGSRKDLSGDTGTAGGYLVPEEFEKTLLQIAEVTSPIIPLVTRVPVNSDTGRYPSLDQYITPTAGAGNTAIAAGVVATATAAGGTLTETEPGFEMIQWRVNKVGGYTEVENELIADSPQAIEVLLTRLFGVAVRSKTEHFVLRGTGAGEPEGILNATAAIGIAPDTNNTFAWADATEMFSRFKSVGGSPVWVIHPGIWPDIGNFESSAGGGVFQANMQAALGNNLLGYPILQSEHLPQDDNSGCVLLADFTAYLLFERSGLTIAFSEHAAFTTDKGTWRFTQRLDGQSWVKSAITLADPQGSFTMSPFVYLND